MIYTVKGIWTALNQMCHVGNMVLHNALFLCSFDKCYIHNIRFAAINKVCLEDYNINRCPFIEYLK